MTIALLALALGAAAGPDAPGRPAPPYTPPPTVRPAQPAPDPLAAPSGQVRAATGAALGEPRVVLRAVRVEVQVVRFAPRG